MAKYEVVMAHGYCQEKTEIVDGVKAIYVDAGMVWFCGGDAEMKEPFFEKDGSPLFVLPRDRFILAMQVADLEPEQANLMRNS